MNEPTDEERSVESDMERSRALTNIYLLLFFVLIVGAGIWIAKVMLDVRKAQECLSSGRRNCTPIDTPVRER
jgi:hypothetical protein